MLGQLTVVVVQVLLGVELSIDVMKCLGQVEKSTLEHLMDKTDEIAKVQGADTFNNLFDRHSFGTILKVELLASINNKSQRKVDALQQLLQDVLLERGKEKFFEEDLDRLAKHSHVCVYRIVDVKMDRWLVR